MTELYSVYKLYPGLDKHNNSVKMFMDTIFILMSNPVRCTPILDNEMA